MRGEPKGNDMKENTLDVLMYLFEHCLDEDREAEQDESMLKGMLRSAGFAQSEINKAFLWLEKLTQQHVNSGSSGIIANESLRIFSAPELAKLDHQCRGFLHALEQHKIIDAGTREIIIERAMALELDELTLERFKWIVMMVLANQPDSEWAHIWLETIIFDRQNGYMH
jgi:Smg protein